MSESRTDAKQVRDLIDGLQGSVWLTEYGAVLERAAYKFESESRRDAEIDGLQSIGKSAHAAIAEMVAALDVDYDRLEELDTTQNNEDINNLIETSEATELVELREAAGECTSREDAEERIREDALSVMVRGGWQSIGEMDRLAGPVEFEILLSTGGPATRLVGDIGEHGEPENVRLEAQDWGTPWTEYREADAETLRAYAAVFYFGDQ